MESKKSSSSSDEIDITQFFHWIGSGFRSFGHSMLVGIAGLRKTFIDNRYYFISIILVGLILGGGFSSFLEKKYYTSSMIISCDYLNMRIIDNTVDKLNLLSNEKNGIGLAEVLDIDIETAKNIDRFTATNFVSENDRVEIEVLKEQLNNVASEKKDLVAKIVDKIEIGNMQSFQISVRVYNPDVVKKLDSAIVNYFKSNEYVKKRIEGNRAKLLTRKEKLISDSKKLDSLKKVLYENFQAMAKRPKEGSNNVILNDKYFTDPINVFREDLNLNNEILEIDEKLYINPDFEVVDGLTTFREPDNFSLPLTAAIALTSSILIGYILLGLWKFNKYLATLESQV